MARAAIAAVLLQVALVSGEALRGVLAPDIGQDSDLAKLRAQVQQRPTVVVETDGSTSGSSGDDEDAQATATIPTARGVRPLALKLPPVAAAGAFVVRSWMLQRAKHRLELELLALAEQCGSRRVGAPDHSRTIRGRLAAADEIRARRELLRTVMKMYIQLDQTVSASQLAARPSAELRQLNASLDARVQACGALLAEYDALGQPTPPGFRAWPFEDVVARRAQLISKGGLLREVLAVGAPVGSPRLDWDMPEWSEARLMAHIAQLREQAADTLARRQKAVLLGKVEAAFWRRREEVPIATASMGTEELERLLEHLEGRGRRSEGASMPPAPPAPPADDAAEEEGTERV